MKNTNQNMRPMTAAQLRTSISEAESRMMEISNELEKTRRAKDADAVDAVVSGRQKNYALASKIQDLEAELAGIEETLIAQRGAFEQIDARERSEATLARAARRKELLQAEADAILEAVRAVDALDSAVHRLDQTYATQREFDPDLVIEPVTRARLVGGSVVGPSVVMRQFELGRGEFYGDHPARKVFEHRQVVEAADRGARAERRAALDAKAGITRDAQGMIVQPPDELGMVPIVSDRNRRYTIRSGDVPAMAAA